MSVQAVAGSARAGRAPRQPAAELPVARVAVDMSLPHLDRPFDYLVPATLAASAVPGAQVRVRFAGQLCSGFVLDRVSASEHTGRLGYLERVIAPEPVLTPELARLARAVADRYGGTMADVLRLAVPPRHAAASKVRASRGGPASDDGTGGDAGPEPGVQAASSTGAAGAGSSGPWDQYPAGPSFVAALAGSRSPRAVWSALPQPDWPEQIAIAVAATARSGRGAVVVVPDARDLRLVDSALERHLGAGQHVALSASLGPAERYRRWISVARGEVSVAAGTRSAMFAPVADLGLVVVWDEGNDLHAEPRAPYPHAREVLALRAHLARCGALIGGFARTAEAELLISTGWARPLMADRAARKQRAPGVQAAGTDAELARDEAARSARLPSIALRTARAALESGPVLVQVPRRGYLTAVACERCHARARCACGGPAELPGPGMPLRCGWCGSAIGRGCRACGHPGLRAVVTGARRTAEELGRALGPVPVRTSGGSAVLDEVGPEPAVIVATPGAEPRAAGGYSAALLLDGWAVLGLPSLRAGEEALRRWMNATALVRPASTGGAVVVVAGAEQPAVQALIRWDPATFAARELAEREELRLPPATRMASVTGTPEAVESLLAAVRLPAGAELLGPLPVTEARAVPPQPAIRYLLRVPRSSGPELATALRDGQAARSAAKEPGVVRIQVDPTVQI